MPVARFLQKLLWSPRAAIVTFVGLAITPYIVASLASTGGVRAGRYALYPDDQLLYFGWIRAAADSPAVGNLFDLDHGGRVFLHPVYAGAGALHRLVGIPVQDCYLSFLAVALPLTIYACVKFVRRHLEAGPAQSVALWVSLLGVAPVAAVATAIGALYGHVDPVESFVTLADDTATLPQMWGYFPGAIAAFLVPLVLLRGSPRDRRGWGLVATAGLAGLVSWLHPWQGAVLLTTLALAEIWLRSTRRATGGSMRAAVVLLVGALPLAYYAVLPRLDESWRVVVGANNAGGAANIGGAPVWAVCVTLAPLAVPAALTYRRPASSWSEVTLRCWPIAALLVFLVPFGASRYHAFMGLALPLSVLAVQGLHDAGQLRRPGVAIGACILASLGPAYALARVVNSAVSREVYPVRAPDRTALTWLSTRADAGVLASYPGSIALPYLTGQETFVGHTAWTPDFARRRAQVDRLLDAVRTRRADTAQRDLAVIRMSAGGRAARWLFASCSDEVSEGAWRSIPLPVRHFGCAEVVDLESPVG